MDKVNDGGPAFPQQLSDGQCERGGTKHFGRAGMTLRDWFAGQAMIALGSSDVRSEEMPNYNVWAKNAFDLADAMLAERAKQKS
jgi:hypothetical protein